MAVQSPRKPQFANVRSSESGTVTLTSSDYRWQIFNASAALTVNLPGGGIAGDVWIIENRGSGALTLKSSDASTIATLNQNDVYGTASVQAAPTSSAHWRKAAGFGLASSTQSGLVTLPSSQIWCSSGITGGALAARGGTSSGETTIRNFTTADVATTGTAITRTARTTTTADYFTISEAGIYSISYTDRCTSGTDAFGISLNSNQLDVSISGITATHRLTYIDQITATNSVSLSATVRCAVGDKIRAHIGAGGTTYANAGATFIITQLCKL